MGRISLTVGVVLVSCATLFGVDPVPVGAVKTGMTAEEVRTAMGGAPKRIARQIMHGHYHELWQYEKPQLLWVEFDCRKGVEARVINVHSGIRPKS